MDDFEAIDFFTDKALVADPYPYFEALRTRCPVAPERHHGVTMVTGLAGGGRRLKRRKTFTS